MMRGGVVSAFCLWQDAFSFNTHIHPVPQGFHAILIAMRDLLIILGVIVAAIAVGAVLFFFGPPAFHTLPNSSGNVSFTLLKEGTNALSMSDRANYEIQNQEQLKELWGYVQGNPDSVPSIDFTKQEVLAVFDGTHSTGGYHIDISKITEANGTRTVQVVRTAPGANCTSNQGLTGPYQVVIVPASTLPLTHVDTSVTQDCK
jgi:hypothetical protein